MRVGISNKSTAVFLLLCYPAFGALGFYLFGWIACCCGLLFAWLLDRFWPKWARDLERQDLATAIGNLKAHGAQGSRLHVVLRNRRIFVHRDQKGSEIRLAVLLFLSEWSDILDRDELEQLAGRFNAKIFFEQWSGRDSVFLSPETGARGCLEVLCCLIDRAEGSLLPKVLAQVDGARRFVWKRYDDTEYTGI